MKIIKLKTEVSTKKGKALDAEIEKLISKKRGKIAFRGLGKGRPVFLTQFQNITNKRLDKTRRKQRFLGAVELLRRVKKGNLTNKKKEPTGEISFEFKGVTPEGNLIGVHIREKIEGKDKKLYLIFIF